MPKITSETQALARAWVAALRSGKFEQDTGQLVIHSTGGYCCLGVYAKINNLLNPDGDVEDVNGDLFGGELTPAQLAELGLTSDEQTFLISINDANKLMSVINPTSSVEVKMPVKADFDTIADVISQWYKL